MGKAADILAPHKSAEEKLRCIVFLKASADKAKHIAWLHKEFKDVKLEEKPDWNSKVMKGYVITTDKKEFLAIHGNPDVELIEEEKFGEEYGEHIQ